VTQAHSPTLGRLRQRQSFLRKPSTKIGWFIAYNLIDFALLRFLFEHAVFTLLPHFDQKK
jgi:hypothetical protein